MKLFVSALLFLVFSFAAFPQSTYSRFKKLSRPEKSWVVFHPFVAKKSFQITKMVLSEVDSIKKTGIIGTDNNGGKLDAFKHAYWMASLARAIGSKKTLKLGKAHEKGNYLQYKKHLLEDNMLPDSVSSEMDLRNNEIGISSAKKSLAPVQRLKTMLLRKADAGCLYTIKKDEQGNFLMCDGSAISMKDWLGKWAIPKCMVYPSIDP